MTTREGLKTLTTKSTSASPKPEASGQGKRPEEQFRLQVDRQTKSSYPTYKAAEEAAMAIKKEHPNVHVSVFDAVERVNRVIAPPAQLTGEH